MKRLYILGLTILLTFSLASCSNQNNDKLDVTPNQTTVKLNQQNINEAV